MTAALPADDVIVAIATPPGRGALAIVRLSGADAHRIASATVAPWPAESRRAVLARILARDGSVLDEAIVVRYDAPASYTGEDAVEITTHGGPAVSSSVLATLLERGARIAEPGEFTRRAVLNGRLDLVQAEATGDLTNATSHAAQRLAIRQLDGALSRAVLSLREQVLEIEALLAYDIDFPEEDDGPISPARILDRLAVVERELGALHASFRRGEMVREGALAVLVGAPNTGKSSLFNALLGQRRAIVTPVPGTTRDALEVVIDGPRWPIRLVDTAGMRSTEDEVERLGIEISLDYARRAAVIVVCGDTPAALDAAAAALPPDAAGTVLRVATKADLAAAPIADTLAVSATQRTGLDALVDAIERLLDQGVATPDDAPVLTNARHRGCIERALSELLAFRTAWQDEGLPATIAAVHLRTAVTSLGDLIGVVGVEDILDVLFARFCIGK